MKNNALRQTNGGFVMPQDEPMQIRSRARENTSRATRRDRGNNPITSILLDMFEKALDQKPDPGNTELARIYNQMILNQIPLSDVKRIVDTYNALPIDVKLLSPPQRFVNSYVSLPSDVKLRITPRSEGTQTDTPVNISRGRITPQQTRQLDIDPSLISLSGLDLALKPNSGVTFDASYWQKVATEWSRIPIIQLPPPTSLTIISVIPQDQDGYSPGDSLRLKVLFPPTKSPSFKVVLSKLQFVDPDKQSAVSDYATLTPTSVLMNKKNPVMSASLIITLPQNFQGEFIRVTMDGEGLVKQLESPSLPIQYQVPPPIKPVTPVVFASPEITAINPPSQLPGRKIIIEGRNFVNVKVLDPGKQSDGSQRETRSSVTFEPRVKLIPSTNEQVELSLPVTVIKPSPVDGIGQLQVTLPPTCIPGDYWLQVENIQNWIYADMYPFTIPGGRLSSVVDFPVRPHQYRVTFNTIHCLDETDPEWWGSDEIITAWAVITENEGWTKNTGEYGGFDDGDVQSYSGNDSSVVRFDGSYIGVGIVLSIQTDIYENDGSDKKAAQAVFQLVGKAASAIGDALKAGAPTAAAIAATVSLVAGAISDFIEDFFGSINKIGSQNVTWDALQLQTLTNNSARQHHGEILFKNSDEWGTYKLSYTVSRLEA